MRTMVAYCVTCFLEYSMKLKDSVAVEYDDGKWGEIDPASVYSSNPQFRFTELRPSECVDHEIFGRRSEKNYL